MVAHWRGLVLLICGGAGTLIKCKDDIGAEISLNLHGALGCEAMARAVDVRAKGNAFFIHRHELAMGVCLITFGACFLGTLCLLDIGELGHLLAKSGPERENLKASRVCDGGAGPVHKGTHSARLAHQRVSGLEIEVIGVTKDGGATELPQLGGRERLDRRLGGRPHKSGCLDHPVRRLDPPPPRQCPRHPFLDCKTHRLTILPENDTKCSSAHKTLTHFTAATTRGKGLRHGSLREIEGGSGQLFQLARTEQFARSMLRSTVAANIFSTRMVVQEQCHGRAGRGWPQDLGHGSFQPLSCRRTLLRMLLHLHDASGCPPAGPGPKVMPVEDSRNRHPCDDRLDSRQSQVAPPLGTLT